MKILITGASGYLGCRLANTLQSTHEHQIHALLRPNSNVEELNHAIIIHFYNGTFESINTAFSTENFDLVIHLAAFATYETTPANIAPLIEANITFGTFILQAMAIHQCTRFINTGTFWQHYQNENYNPVCLYAAMKEAFEDIIEYYVQAHEFNAITLKLTDLYGPKDPRPKLFNLMKEAKNRGETLQVSKGEQYINLLYIDDAINAYIKAVSLIQTEKKSTQLNYFIANLKSYQLKDVIKKYQDFSGEALNITHDKPYRSREVMLPYIGDVLPGWAPSISIDEGIQNVIAAE